MKKILFVFLALSIALGAAAQDNFIFDMPDDFAQLDTVAHPAKFKSIHMIGVSYGVNWSGVTSSPGLGQEKKLTYNNIGVYFTYYHALWDQLFNFGLKFGVMHGYEGYLTPKNNYGETCEVLEVPLISQFKLDFSRFRVLLNLGTYGGYRLSTDKEGGFDRINPSILKADILTTYPNFNERSIGFKRFSDVMKQLEKDGLVRGEMDEQKTMLVQLL